jgi:hypothetical protein
MTLLSMMGLVLFLGGLFGVAGHGIWRTLRSETEGDRVVESGPAGSLAGIPDTVPVEWVMAYRADLDG